MWLVAYITISSTLQGLLKSIPDTLVFQARLVTCKSAKKWYLCACASADCVPLSIAKICLVNYFVNCWWLSNRQKTCKKKDRFENYQRLRKTYAVKVIYTN